MAQKGWNTKHCSRSRWGGLNVKLDFQALSRSPGITPIYDKRRYIHEQKPSKHEGIKKEAGYDTARETGCKAIKERSKIIPGR